MSKVERMQHPYLFATACFVSSTLVASELVSVPWSVIHAKEMGTLRTLCGELAATWPKLWAQPFGTASGERCRDCAMREPQSYARPEGVRP